MKKRKAFGCIVMLMGLQFVGVAGNAYKCMLVKQVSYNCPALQFDQSSCTSTVCQTRIYDSSVWACLFTANTQDDCTPDQNATPVHWKSYTMKCSFYTGYQGGNLCICPSPSQGQQPNDEGATLPCATDI